jgi:4-diphosphocytidyl-2-C-methyl-D-erythritol kinase
LGEIKAPAKVNLSLKVLGRRPDGYRELYGLMARVGLYDQIGVYLVGGQGPDELVCENGIGKPFGDALYFDEAFRGPTNLALRAVGAFRDLTGFPPGPVRVELIKAIPKAAGLGGGSSDAAAVLRLLSRHREVTKVQLKAMAIGLGADVPFFLEDEPFCWAGGRGERLSPYFGPIPGCHAVLVNPGLELPTSEVFGQLGLTTELNGSISLIADSGQESADRQPSWGRNDLEAPAVSLCPTLALTRKAIFETDPPPVRAGLSGSGATYWAIYDQSYKAQRASASLEKQNFWVRLVPLGT